MTLAELSKKYGVHPTQIGAWKSVAMENIMTAFTRRGFIPEQVSIADVDKQHLKVGQLVVEWDFLAKASHQLRGTRGKNGEQGSQAECMSSMQAADADPIPLVLSTEGREC
jgi:transposase